MTLNQELEVFTEIVTRHGWRKVSSDNLFKLEITSTYHSRRYQAIISPSIDGSWMVVLDTGIPASDDRSFAYQFNQFLIRRNNHLGNILWRPEARSGKTQHLVAKVRPDNLVRTLERMNREIDEVYSLIKPD